MDYNQKFNYKSNVEQPLTHKLVESQSSIFYMIATNNDDKNMPKYRMEHSEKIHFTVCDALMKEKLEADTPFVELMTKRLVVTYSHNEHQVRFSSANFLRASESSEINPCDKNDCSVLAECVNDPGTDSGYYCQCKPGFDGDGYNCADINECEDGSIYCAPTASCRNLLGSYDCSCVPPQVGDGRVCENKPETGANEECAKCSPDARCLNDEYGNPYCQCNPGFNGNGYECQLGLDLNYMFYFLFQKVFLFYSKMKI